MKTPYSKHAAVLMALLSCGSASNAGAIDVGVSVGNSNFYASIGNYYRVPQQQVILVRERGILDEEIPVVYLLSQQARVPPSAIVDLRLSGKSWTDITFHYGLSPEIYYVPVRETVIIEKSPPYGHAYGYYKNKPRAQWRTIVLGDPDIIN